MTNVFVHVVRAPVVDPGPLLEQVARLPAMLCTEAAGFLGLTAGISDDGDFVGVARFTQPGGGAWWAALEPWLAGPADVRASSEVELLLGGGSDEAGFVEVIEGRTTDRHRFMALERQLEQRFAAERPDFLGSQIVWWADGSWLEVAYFTSEDDLRAGDARTLSPEVEELVSAWEEVAGASAQLDLARPLVASDVHARLWVVAGCLFEVSLQGRGWRWDGAGPEVTLLADGLRDGRQHLRFRAEAAGAEAGGVELRFERDGAQARAVSVPVRIAPERGLTAPRGAAGGDRDSV